VSDVIEVHVTELMMLFNPVDPAPLRERDLDPRIEDFIVGASRELPRGASFSLLIRVDRLDGGPSAAEISDAVHGFFAARARSSRQRLRQLFRVGRTNLAIGLPVLIMFTGTAQLIATHVASTLGQVLHESLSIGGWVAMWRPLEVFLYDWWPIRADARRFDHLAAMPVRIVDAQGIPDQRQGSLS
jgi:hypothetical protein